MGQYAVSQMTLTVIRWQPWAAPVLEQTSMAQKGGSTQMFYPSCGLSLEVDVLTADGYFSGEHS